MAKYLNKKKKQQQQFSKQNVQQQRIYWIISTTAGHVLQVGFVDFCTIFRELEIKNS